MKQEIIFRFTIPDDNLEHPSDFFTVSAFGEDYHVEYPCGVVGVRRPCANRLGFIVLPTYYEAPKPSVETHTVLHSKDHRPVTETMHRVFVPREVGPGEDFYVTLSNGQQVRLTAPYKSLSEKKPPPYMSTVTVLEFPPPCDDTEKQAFGIRCQWKLAPPPRLTLRITIPPSGAATTSSTTTSTTTKPSPRYFLTQLGTLPAIASFPSSPHTPNDILKKPPPSSAAGNEENQIPPLNSKNGNEPTSITFSIPLARLPCVTNPLGIIRTHHKTAGWYRLYHVTEKRLKWIHLTACQNTCSAGGDGGGGDNESSLKPHLSWHLALTPPSSQPFAVCWDWDNGDGSRLLTCVSAIHVRGLSTIVPNRDRKTLRGDLQTVGTYWDCVQCPGEQARKERIAKWRFKLQTEGSWLISEQASMGENTKPSQLYRAFREGVHSLSSERPLRQSWELQGSSENWRKRAAQYILETEFQTTKADETCWEMHPKTSIESCHLLGLLIGKSIVEGNRPIFSCRFRLATYLYKHILQWPIELKDWQNVDGTEAVSLPTLVDAEAALKDRVFYRIESQLDALLDGVFTILPQSFHFLFRSVEGLQECLEGRY